MSNTEVPTTELVKTAETNTEVLTIGLVKQPWTNTAVLTTELAKTSKLTKSSNYVAGKNHRDNH
jgi:hypothetical protein